MKKTISAMLTITIISSLLPFFANAGGKTLYGSDGRLDLFQASADMKTLADSVVSLWDNSSITLEAASNSYKLKTITLAADQGLRPGEAFGSQPVGAFCSGSLVGEDIVMTAGHCVRFGANTKHGFKCEDFKAAFGFAVANSGGSAPEKIAESEVYACKSVIKHLFTAADGDYALIKLDRKVAGHKALAVNRGAGLKKGDEIFVIGHPSGLPLKVAAGATVRDASKAAYYVTDLDTFEGNSGSPVFNAKTKAVEGILVRGDKDFKPAGTGGNTYYVNPQNGGRGEDVTKIALVRGGIPKTSGEKGAEDLIRNNTIKEVKLGDIGALQANAGSVGFN
ncbi:MAG: serine protease [Elusimicrobia bacterium]|nr:serine protease [Elusimicrobiota bacterium]